MFYNIVVLFLLIFSFPIPLIGNSFQLALFISICNLLYFKRFNVLFKLFSLKYVQNILIFTIFLTLYAAFLPTLFCTNDYSRSFALCSMFVGIISVIIVYSSLYIDYTNNDIIAKLLSLIFLIQSFISILAFISPSFREIVSFFQFKDEMEKAQESYAGIRGLALSGRLYFEYASTCGLIAIIQMKRIIDNRKISYNMIMVFFLLIICGFFAGRTSLFGIIFSFIYMFFSKNNLVSKISLVYKLIICITLFALLIYLMLPSTILEFIKDNLLPWVFDLFIKYKETGSTEDSYSFNMLNDMYNNIQVSFQEWIIGSGRYINENGSYYKDVDAGFLRQLLFWGIIGSIFNFVYSILFIKYPWKVNKKYNDRLILFIILMYTLLLHYKGEILGISRFYYVVLFIFLLHMILKKNKFNVNKISNID